MSLFLEKCRDRGSPRIGVLLSITAAGGTTSAKFEHPVGKIRASGQDGRTFGVSSSVERK
jgi:hypothetical protein